MLAALAASLTCPTCGAALSLDGRALRCPARHTFDVARSGYVNLVAGRQPGVGDTPAMIAARARFLAGGHFEPLSASLATLARAAGPGLAVEVGAGTAHHLARVLDGSPGRLGLAIDASTAAARAAARAHSRAGSVVADARARLPVATAAAGVVLLAFAPRNAAELRRILGEGGLLLVATPLPGHLAELRAAFDLLAVDARKDERLEAALAPAFTLRERHPLSWPLALRREACEALVAMGPSAFHLQAGEIAARAAALDEVTQVTAACRVDVWAPR